MDKPRTRRASSHVTLVLIGAATVGGCGDSPPPQAMQRDLYQHRSQCVQDWGDEKKCEVVSSGQNRGYWYGPSYSAGYGYQSGRSAPSGTTAGGDDTTRQAARPGSRAVETHTVSRGGFGSSSSMHSSGS